MNDQFQVKKEGNTLQKVTYIERLLALVREVAVPLAEQFLLVLNFAIEGGGVNGTTLVGGMVAAEALR